MKYEMFKCDICGEESSSQKFTREAPLLYFDNCAGHWYIGRFDVCDKCRKEYIDAVSNHFAYISKGYDFSNQFKVTRGGEEINEFFSEE